MKRALCGLFLLCAFAFGQIGQSPMQAAPPTFPEGNRSPRQHMPPDQEAPPPQAMSTEQVQLQIEHSFHAEPALASTNVRAHVDDSSVVVTGTVDTEGQHELAMRIAKSNAGDRNVMDKIKVKTPA